MTRLRKGILWAIRKYLHVDTTILAGDLISPKDNPEVTYEAVGVYYRELDLKPELFFRDSNGYIFSGPVDCYQRSRNLDQMQIF